MVQCYRNIQYSVFLEENELIAMEQYNKSLDEVFLLQTIIAILQSLTNNIDLYMSISTEFVNTSSAYANLKDRIDELYKRVSMIPSYHPVNSTITYLYHN